MKKQIKLLFITFVVSVQTVLAGSGDFANAASDSNLDGLGDFSTAQSSALTESRKRGKLLTTNWFNHPKDAFAALTKEDKLIATNVAALAFVALIGYTSWDYGSSGKIFFKSEGGFGSDTKYGGADKLGHAWSTFAFADVLSSYYQDWGYSRERASLFGAISSWVVMGLMEVGDGTSEAHGFAKEDLIANSVGAAMSVFLGQFPEIDDMIDFRIQYDFNTTPGDLLTDYENMTYIAALKLDGVKFIQNKFLKMIELHVGYNTRGYKIDYEDGSKQRNLYVGLNFNFTKFFSERGNKKTSKMLEYLQIPYTSHGIGVNFDAEDKKVEGIMNGPKWNTEDWKEE